MDVRMPKLDGAAALRAIKAQRPATRVILMTAYAAQDLLTQAERDGALRILRKPVQLPALLSLLQEAMRAARSVLVVDDDGDYLTSLCDVLAQNGMAATQAQTLDEALTLLERDAPGAVLLDLKLNGIDVSEGMVAIKEINPSVLLILYSGHPAALSEAVDQAPAGLVNAAFTK